MKTPIFWLRMVATLSVMTNRSPLLADETNDPVPFNYVTNNLTGPSNAPITLATMPPPTPYGEPPLTDSPSTVTNFSALGYCSRIPPDTMGAVGTNRLMVMLNCRYRVQDRGGAVLTNYFTDEWWADVGPFAVRPFDPHVVYDPYRDRWIACAATDISTTNAALLVAASATSDPMGAWYRYRYNVGNSSSADYPLLGFNKDKVVVTFTALGASYYGTDILIFDKETLYAGTAPLLGSTYSRTHLPAERGFIFVPAFTYDTNLASIYLVQTFNSAQGRLVIYEISGTVPSPVITTNGYPTTSGWATIGATPNFAPQLGTSQLIDTDDDRIQSVVYRNGLLWCAHTIFLPASSPTHAAVQWWRIRPSAPLSFRFGRIEDPTGKTNYAYPSIAVNRFDDALIGYSTFSSNQYASAGYSFRDCTNASTAFQNPAVLKAGLGTYRNSSSDLRCRWGDYSATLVDPLNDTDLWTIQEYAAALPVTNSFGEWGTWWGKIELALPGNDNFGNSYALSGGQGSTNGTTVRSSREPSEPDHAGSASTPSVWYSWQAPSAGDVTLTVTNTSSFDVGLAVYTGSTLGSLTLVTNAHSQTGARVTFNAVSNTVYRIAVAGFNGTCGDFTLTWTLPGAPIFTVQPEGRNVFMGSNVTFAAVAIGAPDPAYQWRFNGTNVSGATAASFTTNNVSTNTTGDFTVVATNISGSATSAVAHLQVYSTQKALLSDFRYLTNGFRAVVSGITGATYVVEASTNLTTWSPIETNQTTFTNVDFGATNLRARFYRVLFVP